jgi:epoxyqueuosine reductase
LAERTLAARAGLGFIGKNRMLINPELGPQLLLAEIVTSLKLPTDLPLRLPPRLLVEDKSGGAAGEPIKTSCSNCNKCLTACPTGALRPDGHLDANKCISYLTIEYKNEFPPDLAPKIGARLFGCDECVLACPHQANAPVCKNRQFKFYNDRAKLNLNDILNMSKDDFEAKFADSAFLRLGLDRLKRNAQTCLNNLRPS